MKFTGRQEELLKSKLPKRLYGPWRMPKGTTVEQAVEILIERKRKRDAAA
jgi:hypothetical protein